MTLVTVLQTDAAGFVMECLKDNHRWDYAHRWCRSKNHSNLLAAASPLRSSAHFASAIASHRGFHIWKVAAHLRTEFLCRKALMAHAIGPKLASIPERILSTDFLVSVCNERPDLCHLVSKDIRRDPRIRQLPSPQDEAPEALLPMLYMPRGAFQQSWRAEALHSPEVVALLTPVCKIRAEDEALLTRVFRQCPGLYERCDQYVQRLEYVARTVFARDGLMIRGSPWEYNEAMAAIAVGQNGLALRWLKTRCRNNQTLVEHAVRQNGLALAFASPRLCCEGPIARIAVRQNPAAAAFII